MKKNTTTILALLLLLVLTIACDPQSLDGPTPAPEYGRICLSVSTHPEISIITREGSALTNDQLASYEIKLSGEKKSWTKKYSQITPEDWIVPEGTYTVTATSLTIDEAYPNNTGPGQVRVSGSNEVEVAAGASKVCPITCTPINAKITIVYTDAFENAFPNCKTVKLSQDIQGESKVINRIVDLALSAKTDENPHAAFFEPSKPEKPNYVTWELNLEKDGLTTPKPTGTITPEEGKWTVITFDAKTSSNGSLTLSVTVDGTVQEVTLNQGFNPYKIRQ